MTNIDFNTCMQLILYGGLMIILAICSVTDLTQRRIPNLLTLPTIAVALFIHSIIGGWDGLLFSLAGLALGFAALLFPYLLGGMGAGDVKLMAGVGAVLGAGNTLVALLFIAIAGGILALVLMVHRGIFKQTLSKICVSFLFLVACKDASLLKHDKNEISQDGIPYGIAIASGVCLFFIYLLINKEALPVFGAL